VDSWEAVNPDSNDRIPPLVKEQLGSTGSLNSFPGSPLQPENTTSFEPEKKKKRKTVELNCSLKKDRFLSSI
jgi:hypothetical protein